MGMLYRAFNAVCGANIGPHDGYGGPLMLAGVKPICMMGYIPEDVVVTDPFIKKMQENGRLLTEAANEGRLSMHDVIMPPHPDAPDAPVEHRILRFFCQPGLEDEMMELAAAHETRYEDMSQPMEGLSKSIGEYLGYSQDDIDLWRRGPSRLLDHVPDSILLSARDLMRWVRAKAMLSEGWDNSAYNQNPVGPSAKSNIDTHL